MAAVALFSGFVALREGSEQKGRASSAGSLALEMSASFGGDIVCISPSPEEFAWSFKKNARRAT
jgi:hypothetical protein